MANTSRSRWLPDTLAWWTFTLLLGVVILLSGTTLVFLLVNRDDAEIAAAANQAANQVITIKRMVERDKPEDRAALIRRFSSPMMRILITRTPVVEHSDDRLLTRNSAAQTARRVSGQHRYPRRQPDRTAQAG